ncbi:MAG: ATP-binding protein [Anaerolineae bacterium]
MPPLTSLLELITTQSGALVYQLVTLFAIQLILGVSFGHWQRRRDGASLRLLTMATGVFLARVILMVAALLGRSGLLHSRSALPPLERCLDLVTTVLVAWALVPIMERHPRLSTRGLVVAVLGAAATYVIFARLWPGAEAQGLAYNGYWQERVWEGLTSATLALALVASTSWRGADWGWLVCLIGLWLAGHSLQLIAPVRDADTAGWVRLANLAALPLLAALVYRRALGTTSDGVVDREEVTLGVVGMLKAIQRIEADSQAEPALELAASAIARTLDADMVAIGLRIPESTDAVRVVALHPATSLTLANQQTTLLVSRYPLLSTALQSRHLERAVADTQVSRLGGLYRDLGFDASGPLLVQPLTAGDDVLGAVLAGNPISRRAWRMPDGQVLQALAAPLASAVAGSRERRRVVHQALEEARREIESKAEHARQIEAELEQQHRRTEEFLAELRQREERMHQLEEAQAVAATAQEELAKSVEAHSALRTLLSHWQEEAQRLREEKAELENQLAQSASEESPGRRLDGGATQSKMVASLAEELRTPMTSIARYTDRLLGEEPSVLGESQRRHLQRVEANIARMDGLLNDLIRATRVDLGQVELAPEPVDLNTAVQDVLHALSARLEEKGLRVQSDLEADLPPVHVDQDSLHQVLLNLLSNATLAARPGTVVQLCTRVKEPSGELEDLPDFALVSITDTGGGIAAEDQPRVFRPLSDDDGPRIGGLGETGAVLSGARSLIEAHGGRIWVESAPGVGSTFNFILPLPAAREDLGTAPDREVGASGE